MVAYEGEYKRAVCSLFVRLLEQTQTLLSLCLCLSPCTQAPPTFPRCICQQLALIFMFVCMSQVQWGPIFKILNRSPSMLAASTANAIRKMPCIQEIEVDICYLTALAALFFDSVLTK